MHGSMASSAQRNQILLRIIAGVAAKVFVVDFQVRHCAASLASPAVPAQHLLAQAFVQFYVESNARISGLNAIHDAFSVK